MMFRDKGLTGQDICPGWTVSIEQKIGLQQPQQANADPTTHTCQQTRSYTLYYTHTNTHSRPMPLFLGLNIEGLSTQATYRAPPPLF